MALKYENDEGGNGATETELVDKWMEHPNPNSNQNKVVGLNPITIGLFYPTVYGGWGVWCARLTDDPLK